VDLISQTLTKTLGKAMAKAGEKLLVYIEPYRPDDEENMRANYTLGVKAGVVKKDELRTKLLHLSPLGPENGGDEFCGQQALAEEPPVDPNADPLADPEGKPDPNAKPEDKPTFGKPPAKPKPGEKPKPGGKPGAPATEDSAGDKE